MNFTQQGYIFKKKSGLGKKFKRLYLVQIQFVLKIFDQENYKEDDILDVIDIREVNHYAIGPVKDNCFFFDVRTPNKRYVFYSVSEEDRERWIKGIGKFSESGGAKGTMKIKEDEEVVDLSRSGISVVPLSLFNNKKVVRLDLSGNDLGDFSPLICGLETLQIINLSGNGLSQIPREIERLPQLKELVLNKNNFIHIPPVLENIPTLQVLSFQQNKLSEIPNWISTLGDLHTFSIAFNPDVVLNEGLFQCPSLTWLDITSTRIISLSEDIGNLQLLQVLEANNNYLKKIPNSICSLPYLRELRLSRNKLDSLPEAIGQLEQLQELEIPFNQLTSLPVSLCNSPAFIQVHNNPNLNIPQDVLAAGSTRIKEHLSENLILVL